ncbi:MAG TPA: ABC transporter permease [Bryobacteraceae bacterium]|jgi:ABC-2 type transport system permease protein|nr:ABC transporter permease [Bryobacteraceae bacterium]
MFSIYYKEAKYEFLRLLRFPGFSLPTILFPVMFYVLFGLVLPTGPSAGVTAAKYLLGTYGTFGVMGVSLFGFGVSVSNDRGYGWLELKQASPMPLMAYFVAKLAMAALFSLAVTGIMLGLGLTLGHVEMSAIEVARLVSILVLGSIPFGAMGLLVGHTAKPTSASAIVNCLYLPMSFLSGLWVPIQFLPQALQNFAVIFPPYHMGRLALGVFGAADDHWITHAIALAGFTMLFLGAAWLFSGPHARPNWLASTTNASQGKVATN